MRDVGSCPLNLSLRMKFSVSRTGLRGSGDQSRIREAVGVIQRIRWLAREPWQQHLILWMISYAINIYRISRIWHHGQWVAGFEIILAAERGTGILPRGNQISAEWIVEPFGNLMAHRSHICDARTKNSLVHPACPHQGLNHLRVFDLACI